MSSLLTTEYSGITPKKHIFDLALKKIRDFANSAPSIPEIDKFKVAGSILRFTNHNVTGEEMNQHVAEVNKIFIQQNKLILSTIKEFQTIYNTFNELDQDYIAGIVASLNGVKKSIEVAAYAQKCIEESQLNILVTQEDIQKANKQIENTNRDIQKTIEALKATVNSLLDNKRKVVNLEERLSNLELLRGDVIKIKENINLAEINHFLISAKIYVAQYEEFSNKLDFNKECTDVLTLIQSQYKADIDQKLANQKANANRIEDELLACIDTISQNVDSLRKSIDEQLNESVASFKQAIASVSKDSKEHIDALALVESLHKTDTDQKLAEQQTNTERIENYMLACVDTINQNIDTLRKSIDEQLNISIALLKQTITNVSKDSKERIDALALVESQHKTDVDLKLVDQQANANRIENEMHSYVKNINKNAEMFKELALAKLADSESSIMNIISQLKEQYNIDKTQNQIKFRWLFGIAGSSLLLNVVLIIFKCLGIL